MRPERVANCGESLMCSSQTDPGITYQWLNLFEQQPLGPRATLETTCQNAGGTTSDDVAETTAHMETSRGFVCQSAQGKNFNRVPSCNQLRKEQVRLDVVRNFPHLSKKLDCMFTLSVGQFDARSTCDMGSES